MSTHDSAHRYNCFEIQRIQGRIPKFWAGGVRWQPEVPVLNFQLNLKWPSLESRGNRLQEQQTRNKNSMPQPQNFKKQPLLRPATWRNSTKHAVTHAATRDAKRTPFVQTDCVEPLSYLALFNFKFQFQYQSTSSATRKLGSLRSYHHFTPFLLLNLRIVRDTVTQFDITELDPLFHSAYCRDAVRRNVPQ